MSEVVAVLVNVSKMFLVRQRCSAVLPAPHGVRRPRRDGASAPYRFEESRVLWAGIGRQHLSEVVVALDGAPPSSESQVGQRQQRSVFGSGITAEIVLCLGEISASQLPNTAALPIACRIDRIKAGANGRIYAICSGASVARPVLDGWQVRLERRSVIILRAVEQRTRKQDCARMVLF